MSDAKTINMKAKLSVDTAEMDRAIEAMQRKAKEIYAQSDAVRSQTQLNGRLQTAGVGPVAAPGSGAQDFGRVAEKARVDAMKHLHSEVREQTKQKELIDANAKNIAKLTQEKEKAVKASAEELRIAKELQAATQTRIDLLDQYNRRNSAILDFTKEKERQEKLGSGAKNPAIPMGAPPAPPAPPPPPRAPFQSPYEGGDLGGDQNKEENKAIAKLVKGISKGVGLAMAGIAAGSAVYDDYTSIAIQRNRSTGNATQSFLGNEIGNMASGNVIDQFGWMGEKQKAMQMAGERSEASQNVDLMKSISGQGVLGQLGGMLGIGSGGGRAWDLTANAGLNMASSGVGAVEKFFGGSGKISKSLDKMAEEYITRYSASVAEEFGQNYQQMVDSEKKKNPLKNLAITQFGQNYGKDLDAQRMLGLDYSSYHGRGGYQEVANKAGFGSDLALQMSNSMGAAGGSTRAMTGSSVLGMQMSRGMDLTNSGSILGKLSGAIGGSQATNSVAMKLLEESFKNGLDKSELRAENRKFTEMAAGIIVQSGARSEGEVAGVLASFSKLVGGNPTMRGLEGAKSAYDEVQNLQSQTNGRFGAMQQASFMKNPKLKNLGMMERGALAELNPEEINADHPMIIALSRMAKLSPEELAKEVKDDKKKALLYGAGLSPKAMDDLGEYIDKNGMRGRSATKEELGAMPDEIYQAYKKSYTHGAAVTEKGTSEKLTGISQSMLPDIKNGDALYGPGNFAGIAKQAVSKTETGRAEDNVVQSLATQSQAFLENFRKFKDEITPASTAVEEFTKKIVLLSSALQLIPDKDKAEAATQIQQQILGSQPQAGKPAPGK